MASSRLPSGAVHPDTQAVLLLCGTFAGESASDAKPLTLGEYNSVASWLSREGKHPASLLENADDLLSSEELGLPPRERLRTLLGRGFQMAAALESWQRLGLWVISRGEDRYPERLRRTLGSSAPVLLYGAGDVGRLSQGGLAVVGSRDVDEEGLDFTRRVGERCAGQDVQIISGGARGVDRAAVAAALEAGGGAVVVLGERLDRAATARDAREPLRDGRLTLITPYEPEASFTVGRVMGRNKHIYGLADHALVVRFTPHEGGTWAGAVEQLGRNSSEADRVPIFVRVAHNPEDGCAELQRRGAFIFPEEDFWRGRVMDLLNRASPQPAPEIEPDAPPQAPEMTPPTDTASSTPAPPSTPPASREAETCYERCLPLILQNLHRETGAKQLAKLAERLQLLPKQLEAWINRAVEEGKVTKKKKKGRIVYVSTSASAEPTLFDRGGDAA
jgi:predicted Rossmann fold nucleotide-binding protein DprA/Smf involved in DNA uptake